MFNLVGSEPRCRKDYCFNYCRLYDKSIIDWRIKTTCGVHGVSYFLFDIPSELTTAQSGVAQISHVVLTAVSNPVPLSDHCDSS